MGCSCRHHEYPPVVNIPPGREHLPRLIASYGQFRRAMLDDASQRAVFADWSAREQGDLGVLLIEMWAVACEIVAFADETICHECFVRTARRDESLRCLVEVLGYRPRPAIAASVELSLSASGRKPIELAAGTAFRSGAVDEHPPQVFVLGDAATVHPLTNRLTAQRARLTSFAASAAAGGAGGGALTELTVLLDGYGLGTGATVLIEADTGSWMTTLASVAAPTGPGPKRATLAFAAPLALPDTTTWDSIAVKVSDVSAALWTIDTTTATQPGVSTSGGATTLRLDRVYDRFTAGDTVAVTDGTHTRLFTLESVAGSTYRIADDTEYEVDGDDYVLPGATVPLTELALDTTINDTARKLTGDTATWDDDDNAHLTVLGGWRVAGRGAAPHSDELATVDSGIDLDEGTDTPWQEHQPTSFTIIDRDDRAVSVTGAIDWSTKRLAFDPVPAWGPPLRFPIRVAGNVVTATRGETVVGEVLGSGDAARANQSFELANAPLTYLGPGASTSGEVATTTLTVWVDGVQWSEVDHFVLSRPTDRVYVTRTDDAGVTEIVFGDGVNGARLPTGTDNVVADYRFGAGAIHPGAGSISTMVEPIDGISSITNPLSAYGGADAAAGDELREQAPRSALLLGRIVSRDDAVAVALDTPGVVTAVADWDWRPDRIGPAVLVRYVGHENVASSLRARIRSMVERDVPIDAVVAPPDNVEIGVAVAPDPKRHHDDVIAAVIAALTGPGGVLTPAVLGVDGPLYRSRLAAAASVVDGVRAVAGLYLNGEVFDDFAVAPAAGHHLDVTDSLSVWTEELADGS